MLSAFLLALIVPVQPQVRVGFGVDVHVPAPVVRFEAEPALVVVSPGVMVVPNHDREVFFSNGWYWHHSGGVWFRTRHHRGGWARVSTRYVPRTIVRYPRGHYRHYRGGRPYVRARGHYRGRPTGRVVRVNGNGKVKVKHFKKRRHHHD